MVSRRYSVLLGVTRRLGVSAVKCRKGAHRGDAEAPRPRRDFIPTDSLWGAVCFPGR